MKTKKFRAKYITWLVFAAALFTAVSVRSDSSQIDKLIEKLDATLTKQQPIVMNLDECIAAAVANNADLKVKQAILNSVEGDRLIDRSRFFSHVDFLANTSRNQGTLLKSYFPTLNPMPVASLGGLETSTFSASSGSSSNSSISAIASQFGITDISSLLSQVPAEYQSMIPAGLFRAQGAGDSSDASRASQRVAAQTIPGIPNINLDQLQQLLDQVQTLSDLLNSTSSSSQRTVVNTDLSFRYSQRLIEWGKDSSSSVSIRKNKRLAITNYDQKLRDVISNVRNSFFQILLKKEQISTREKLLKEYEEKLWKQQKRFEIAKDVPRIDVLTAELDVLNEKNRINNLRSDLVKRKLELLQLINLPFASDFDVVGELQPFNFSVAEVVKLTNDNSFQVTYLKDELKESERVFKELAWDYKPIYTAKIGAENQHAGMGLSLNNSNQTYGVDLGVVRYLNLPTSSSSSLFGLSSERTRNNYNMSAGLAWNLYDNTQRKGVEKKHIEKLNQARIELDQEIQSEDLSARQAYQDLIEAVDGLKLQRDIVENSRRRLEITRKLREYGKVNEFQVDSLRNTFFSDQDRYFTQQENVIAAQEKLRSIMGVFQ
ncbi:MAG: TolC family protein [bacterium]